MLGEPSKFSVYSWPSFVKVQLSPDSWEWSMSLWIELCTAHLCVSTTVKYSAWCGLRKWRKYSRCSGIDHLQGSEFHWSVDGVTNVDCNSQSQLLQILIGSSCWRWKFSRETTACISLKMEIDITVSLERGIIWC